MSAMVSQIALEHAGVVDSQDASTEPETLDDIFSEYQSEILCDNNLQQREPPEDSDDGAMHIKGVLNPSITVYETYDTSTKPLQTLPAGIAD